MLYQERLLTGIAVETFPFIRREGGVSLSNFGMVTKQEPLSSRFAKRGESATNNRAISYAGKVFDFCYNSGAEAAVPDKLEMFRLVTVLLRPYFFGIAVGLFFVGVYTKEKR